jgi:hypothetical protein
MEHTATEDNRKAFAKANAVIVVAYWRTDSGVGSA